MAIIAVYLFSISALSGYRMSRYWPAAITGFSRVSGPWWGWVAALAGTAAMVAAQGWVTGLLVSCCAYTALLSVVIFFAACGRRVWRGAVVTFHVLCVFLLLLMYWYAG